MQCMFAARTPYMHAAGDPQPRLLHFLFHSRNNYYTGWLLDETSNEQVS